MKIETLNIWGGRIYDALVEHLKKQSEIVDIFCFQEAYSTKSDRVFTRTSEEENGESMWEATYIPRANNFEDFQKILPDFIGYYYSAQDGYDYHGPVEYQLSYGLMIFIRKDIEIIAEGDTFVFRWKNSVIGKDNRTLGRNLQYIQFKHKEEIYVVANFHGLWNGQGKTDTPDRLEQSEKVREFLDTLDGKKILVGDFNLLPDSKSLKVVGEGMRDLVKEYGVTSTRSQLYEKPVKYADYIFVSPEITVVDFKVLPDVVSDHAPLVVEIA